MNSKITLLIILLTFIELNLFSQSETSMYTMDFVPQSTFFNPATKPQTKFSFGFSVPIQVTVPFTYNDIFIKKDDGTATIDSKYFYENLRPYSYMSLESSPDISLGFSFKKRFYFMLGIRQIAQGGFRLPKTFFDLAINGNVNDQGGSSKNISNFNFGGFNYREYSLGGSYDIDCKWTVGGKLKLLNGYQNISTANATLEVETDPNNYDITVKGDYLIHTSGMTDEAVTEYSQNINRFTKNVGFGMDLGAKYKFNDKITFSASVLDLGFIRWKENNQILSNKNKSSVSFSGITLSSYDQLDVNYIQKVLDTMIEYFDVKTEDTDEGYTTSLKTRGYLNFDYKVLKQLNIGATANIYTRYGSFYPVLSLYGITTFKKILQFQLAYSITRFSYFNIGAGLAVNAGPIQLFCVSDNLYGALFDPKNARDFNARAGINLQWSYGKRNSLCEEELDEIYKQQDTEDTLISTIDTINDEELPNTEFIENDMDHDGILDSMDLCPQIEGEWKWKGCPDKKSMRQVIKKREGYRTKTPTRTIENPDGIENERYPTQSNPRFPVPNQQTPNIKKPRESNPRTIFRGDQFKPKLPSSPSPNRSPRLY